MSYWSKDSEENLKELGFSEQQIEQLSDKTKVGIGMVTEVLLEAIKQGLVVKNNSNFKL